MSGSIGTAARVLFGAAREAVNLTGSDENDLDAHDFDDPTSWGAEEDSGDSEESGTTDVFDDLVKRGVKLFVGELPIADSSCIASARYDGLSGKLSITFRNGEEAIYPDVPLSVIVMFVASPSPGSFYYRHIRGNADLASSTSPFSKARKFVKVARFASRFAK